MKNDFVFTSDSVTEGHPDKLCDQISDAIVDHFLYSDRYAHLSAECAVATGVLFVATQFNADAVVDIPEIARRVIEQVGYDEEDFNARDCTILTNIHEIARPRNTPGDAQSLSEDRLDTIVASHPATVFGFACDQNPAYLPQPIWLAHRFARQLADTRKEGKLDYLLPDGLAQVSVEYRDRRPAHMHTLNLLASQRSADSPSAKQVHSDLIASVVEPLAQDPATLIDDKTRIFVNPEGPIVGAGPNQHAGLTGRKISIDTYGQYSRQSGAALSGKDPYRIDRIGAYFARYVAKNIVAAGLAAECEVHLSYSLGQALPLSVQVHTYGTATIAEEEIARRVSTQFDFRVGAVVRTLGLHQPPPVNDFYQRLACYGQMGRLDIVPAWEQVDRADRLREG
jgi:S-adenosylmethionine synthetase